MATLARASSQGRRIACVQLDSKHADVPRNTDTVLSLVTLLIAERKSNPVDLIVLPELALTGYVFESKDEIKSLLEDASDFSTPSPLEPTSTSPSSFISACRESCALSKQPSLTLAAHLAQQLHCHVVIGFPELDSDRASSDLAPCTNSHAIAAPFDARPLDAQTAPTPTGTEERRAYNSAALFAPDGSLVHVFRKHFLFQNDEVWADEGPGFETIHLPTLGTVCVAICMDLNPYQFRTPFESCELASFCLARDVDLLIMPMAWNMPSDEREQYKPSEPKPSLSTINYWALRCQPFFAESPTSAHEGGGASQGSTRFLLAANRMGTEASSTFAGSSCVLQMKPGERPLLLDSLGATQGSCLVVDLPA